MSKGTRRGLGGGSVYRRDSDGRWVGTLDLGWVEGKRRRRVVYGRTQSEAFAKLKELSRAKDSGVNLLARPRTVDEWLTEWLDDLKAHDGTRASTLARYQQVVRAHLKPGLGRIRLDRLSPDDVRQFLARRRDTLSPASLVKVHGVLRAALADAERMDLVSRNVARAVKPPRIGRAERSALTHEQAKNLLQVAEGDRLEPLLILALVLGLRRGELLGLCWPDVDLDVKRVTVRRAVQRVDGGLRLVDVKTHRSRRALPLPARAVQALERQRARQAADRLQIGPSWHDHDLVFASTIGTLLEPRNVNRRFADLRKDANLPWLHFHDLRHACATFLLSEGVDPRTVMELLGHSTIRLTMDTYGHVLPDRLHAAADAMDRALGE